LRLLFLLLLAGCSHATIDAGVNATHGPVPPAGGSVAGGGVEVHAHSHSLAAIVIAGMFIAAAAEHAQETRGMPSFSSFADWFRGTRAPKMAADRPVAEQDCTRPVELTGNLKCR
jgi:hypothetical protein